MKLSTLDARVKLLMLLAVSSAALATAKAPSLLAILGLTLLALLLGGVEVRRLWRQIRGILGMIALIFLLQCLFRRDGAPLIVARGLTIMTSGGLETAALVALRLLIIVSSALIMLTGQIRDYLLALSWCRLPYEIVYMTMAALRFIPLLREEAQDVFWAIQMRGCDMKKASWPERARHYLAMLLPITAGALHRAEQTAIAMEARAFRALPRRSQWRKLSFTRRDIIYTLIFMLLLSAILAVV